jgi:hypothetical protein
MAFVLKDRDTFPRLIEFELPGDGDKSQKCSFTGEFLLPSQSRLEEVAKLSEEGKINDIQFASEILVGWGEDMKDPDGDPIDYSEQTLAKVLQKPKVAAAVVTTFYNSLRDKGGKRGN